GILAVIEREFYISYMSRPDPDHLRYGRIAGTAARHAPAWQLRGGGKAAAIAELAEGADGRGDLLAKCAGLALGFRERRPEADHYQRMAELCIAAGADKTLIERWIVVGRQRAASGATPYPGYLPSGLTPCGPAARTTPPPCAGAGPRQYQPARVLAWPRTVLSVPARGPRG